MALASVVLYECSIPHDEGKCNRKRDHVLDWTHVFMLTITVIYVIMLTEVRKTCGDGDGIISSIRC